MADLAALPIDHQLRNRPLAEIGAEYRNLQGVKWTPIAASFAIGRCAFNDLGGPWITCNEWRA